MAGRFWTLFSPRAGPFSGESPESLADKGIKRLWESAALWAGVCGDLCGFFCALLGLLGWVQSAIHAAPVPDTAWTQT